MAEKTKILYDRIQLFLVLVILVFLLIFLLLFSFIVIIINYKVLLKMVHCRQNSSAKPYLLEMYHLKPTGGHTLVFLIYKGGSRSGFTETQEKSDWSTTKWLPSISPYSTQLSSDITYYQKPLIIPPVPLFLDSPLGNPTRKGKDHIYLNHHWIILI